MEKGETIVEVFARMKQSRTARMLAVLAGLTLGAAGSFAPAEAAASATAAAVANDLSRPNAAQVQLFDDEVTAREQRQAARPQQAPVTHTPAPVTHATAPAAAKPAASTAPAAAKPAASTAPATAPAQAKSVEPGRRVGPGVHLGGRRYLSKTESQLTNVIPEAKKKIVSIHRLSKQVQFLNDGGAMHAHADFQRGTSGYILTLTAEKAHPEQTTLTVSNTGNDYTGNWRTALSYVNRNVTHQADTVGLAFVTSPSAGHIKDVKQAAFAYRIPVPKSSDAWTFTASYSDVDLGSVIQEGGIDFGASGKGKTAAIHYQRNLAYTSHEKDGWDFGVNYWNMTNDYSYRASGSSSGDETDYNATTANATFFHNDRDARHSFSYQAGIETSLTVAGDYQRATTGSDKRFQLYKAGMNYSYRTPDDWIFGLRWNGQYTNKNIVSCLQLGAGGRTTVRGFMERAIAADKGILGSLEIYTPQFAPGSRFVFFLDGASLSNNNENAYFDHQSIASYGIGYRYQTKNVSVALDYAGILKDLDDENDQQHKRWNFLASWSF